MSGDTGLGEDWKRLLHDLDAIVEIYEKGNNLMSFGRDVSLRKEILQRGMPESGLFLDVGSGPGNMSAMAKDLRPDTEGVMMDPLPSMLRRAMIERGEKSFMYVCGIYEALPFRSGSFVACLAGFTIRDAIDRIKAYQDIHRVLKDNGVFLIIDLAKPDSAVKRFFVGTYWRLLAPLMLSLYLGSKARHFADIYITYKHLPRNRVFIEQLEKAFRKVWYETKMVDGVIMVKACKDESQC
ncbi:MAG: class I SAM-dependent methyltransferase [Conexivisphaerales archaeon]